MVADPRIAPHPALAAAQDPTLAAVRHIAARITNAPMTDLVPPYRQRRWLAGRAEARRGALSVQDLANLDVEDIAEWFTAHYVCRVRRAYPGVVIGSINSAMVGVCMATGMPWLPQTMMLPLRWEPRCWSSLPAAAALGIQAAAAFHGRNPEVALHQSYDEWPGPAAGCGAPRMRAKLRRLPGAYVKFLDSSVAADAIVILLQDESVWPTTRFSDRHVLHLGSRHNPPAVKPTDTVIPDGLSPDAEIGFDPDLGAQVARWSATRGRLLYRVRIRDALAVRPARPEVARHRGRRPVRRARAASTEQAALWPTLLPRWRNHG